VFSHHPLSGQPKDENILSGSLSILAVYSAVVQPDQERPHVGATSNLIALRRTGVFGSPTMDRFLSEDGVLDDDSRTIPTAIA
jgi:hypothetical protein